VQALALGRFGQAVAAELAAVLDGVTVRTGSLPTGEPLPRPGRVRGGQGGPGARRRPVPAVTEEVDARSHATATPWLPVLIEAGALRVGPMVVPGTSACHRCFRRRLRQHAPARAVEAALERHFTASGDDEPYGHLPGTAVLAATAAADVLDLAAADPAAAGGQVRQQDLASGRLTTGRVVGVHGCDRCGLHRDERTRSTLDLQPALREALRWTG